jgi:hypothetical protein
MLDILCGCFMKKKKSQLATDEFWGKIKGS